MGMFDSVRIKCPACNADNEIQSKGGRCDLDTYDQYDVPIEIAIGLDYKMECENCKKQWNITYAKYNVSVFLTDNLNKDEDY
ncbi:hypothetical protein ACFX5K_01215 [Rickettsiales bacterium LUAb2]